MNDGDDTSSFNDVTSCDGLFYNLLKKVKSKVGDRKSVV